MTKYWWVNQGQSFAQEVGGGYLWAPKTQKDGVSLRSYSLMLELQPGDIVYSHYKGNVRARGIVRARAVESRQPENLLAIGQSLWLDDGWLVQVDFETSLTPLVTKAHFRDMYPLLLEEYPVPIASNGNAAQKNYLTRISEQLATYLDAHLLFDGLHDWQLDQLLLEKAAAEDEVNLLDEDLTETDRNQLILARQGQGRYRLRVLNFERVCRVTGLNQADLLIASHIKPWAISSNVERLNGANGLMLSPHVDKLFDRGLISFSNGGKIIVSKTLSPATLDKWHIDKSKNVGKFSRLQGAFLEYHRDVVLK